MSLGDAYLLLSQRVPLPPGRLHAHHGSADPRGGLVGGRQGPPECGACLYPDRRWDIGGKRDSHLSRCINGRLGPVFAGGVGHPGGVRGGPGTGLAMVRGSADHDPGSTAEPGAHRPRGVGGPRLALHAGDAKRGRPASAGREPRRHHLARLHHARPMQRRLPGDDRTHRGAGVGASGVRALWRLDAPRCGVVRRADADGSV